jgi:hypothetical protein
VWPGLLCNGASVQAAPWTFVQYPQPFSCYDPPAASRGLLEAVPLQKGKGQKNEAQQQLSNNGTVLHDHDRRVVGNIISHPLEPTRTMIITSTSLAEAQRGSYWPLAQCLEQSGRTRTMP